ncbi:MAG: DDE-type integrase/transposase/recombinase [Burkholderiaceae bacterium]|nr:DDE-type integrase/transposase/recombinase [Burkholderiaceae bacterium]
MASKRVTATYTPQERIEILGLAEQVGPTEAAKRKGVPRGTVTGWRSQAKDRAQRQPVAQPAQEQPLTPAAVRKRLSSKRVARVYTPSEKASALELVQQLGVTEAHKRTGISRFSLHEWGRIHDLAMQGQGVSDPLVDETTPKSDRDARILAEWQKHPGLGPSQIRNQLRRGGFKVSVRTVRMVMEEHGYVLPKVKRKEAHDQRYEAIRPNQLWHMDFLQRHIHKQKISVLFIVDDFSRYIPGFAMWDEDRSEAVLECFEQAVSRHGKPESVMSDGGAAFWAWRGVSRFSRVLEEMGIDQIVAKVPQHNGKLEVLNANVQKELFNQERFFDLGEAAARLRAWVAFYNLRRTHHALGGLLVPADRYFGRSDEVLAQIEAGAVPDGIGEPIAVAERMLDVIRVTSRAGKVELWMMGQRVWSQTSMP